jgi:hypothetical protein
MESRIIEDCEWTIIIITHNDSFVDRVVFDVSQGSGVVS